MKHIENQLREDARMIGAQVPDGVQARIGSALRREPAADESARGAFFTPRLAAGVAASLALVIAGLAWFGQAELRHEAAQPAAAEDISLKGYETAVAQLALGVDRRAMPEAELKLELEHLHSDFEKIRSHVRSQLDPLL